MSVAAHPRALYHRARYLPAQLEAARAKVRMLENEARRYGLHDLLPDQAA